MLLLLPLAGCVSYEPAVLVPSITLSPEQVIVRTVDRGAGTRQLDFGIDVTVNESDSLFNVETLPGIRVRGVTPGGAAAAAGIETGDVVLSVNGLATDHPDTLATIETQPLRQEPYLFEVRRNTRVLEARVTPETMREPGLGTVELYRVDPIATRAGYDTQLVTVSAESVIGSRDVGDNRRTVKSGNTADSENTRTVQLAAARIRKVFPESPLPDAGLAVGDLILTLDGQPLNSAQDLVNRLNQEMELGQRVTLGVYDG